MLENKLIKEIYMKKDDIEITHNDGQTIVRGLDQDKIRGFRDKAKKGGNASIDFQGVKKIDVLRPGTNDPSQTILGEE